MKRSFNSILLAMVILFMASCAGTYGPKNAAGGYSDWQNEDGTYEVMFEGHKNDSKDLVRTYLVYRCSEIALENGYSHFLIMDETTEQEGEETEQKTEVVLHAQRGLLGGVNLSSDSNYTGENASTQYRARMTIKLLHGKDPRYPSASMDAQAFIDTNKSKIKKR
ncbi:MAG: hypothetical protein K9N35_05045 [Candidatus Marinimicrobia bacterium]|nr:hypothetical protein [Candidatus Neomarinimicrobiota bacterium]